MVDRLPSQRDVAALAGVSRATVSAVLNGASGVKLAEATRQRVLAAAGQLGFQPNIAARSLRSRRSDLVGLVTSQIATTPYAVAIIKGAQDTAHRLGKTLLIVDIDHDRAAADEAIAKLAGWRVEGLAIATDYHREVQPLGWAPGTPVALVNCFLADPATTVGSLGDPATTGTTVARSGAEPAIPSIVPDEQQGGELATRTLIEVGHRRIGLVNGPAGYPASAGRLAGYLAAHRAAGLPVDRRLVRVGDWWQESGWRHANALLDLEDAPTALFCANDWMAMGAYDAIKERGLRIPADVSLIGFDDRVEIAAHLRPTLTTVALPYHEMGALAVEQVLAAMPVPGPTRQLVACRLVRRASVAAPLTA